MNFESRRFLAAGGMFLGGALGVEMAGVLVFLHSLLGYMSDSGSSSIAVAVESS